MTRYVQHLAGRLSLRFMNLLLLTLIVCSCIPVIAADFTDGDYTITDTTSWFEDAVRVNAGTGTTKDIVVTVTGSSFTTTPNLDTGQPEPDQTANSLSISATNGGTQNDAADDYEAQLTISTNDSYFSFKTVDIEGVRRTETIKTQADAVMNSGKFKIDGNNNTMWVTNTTLKEGSVLDLLEGSGNIFETDILNMNGGPGIAKIEGVVSADPDFGIAKISVSSENTLHVVKTANISENAVLAINNKGTIIFSGKAFVGGGGGNARIDMTEDSNITLNFIRDSTSKDITANGILTVGTGGILNITDGNAVIKKIQRTAEGIFDVDITDSGRLHIESGANLAVDTIRITSDRETAKPEEGPSGAITGKGTLNAKILSIDGGIVDLTGAIRLDDSGIMVDRNENGNIITELAGSGRMEIVGESRVTIKDGGNIAAASGTKGTVAVSGGTLNIGTKDSIGTIGDASLGVEVSGSGSVIVESKGVIAPDTEFTVRGGDATFKTNSTVNNLKTLAVRGSGTLYVHNEATTKQLTVSDGMLNVYDSVTASNGFDFGGGMIILQGGSLNVTGGTSKLYGGNLYLENVSASKASANFYSDVTIESGGIHSDLTFKNGEIQRPNVNDPIETGRVNMNGKSLSIANKEAFLDTEYGMLEISGVAKFTLDGTLKVGRRHEQDLITTITGMESADGILEVGSNAQVTMTENMQYYVNSILSGGADARVKVLDTEGLTLASGESISFYWYDPIAMVTYKYTVDDADNDIYVTGAESANRDDMYANIIAGWREHPNIGNYVDNVLNDSMLSAIVDARDIDLGLAPGSDTLDASGQFNSSSLLKLLSPGDSGAGYDALMLYNGSGLGMASQAAVTANARILNRIDRRAADLRHEIRRNDPVPGDYPPEPLPVNRVWAEGIYLSDNSGHDRGFGGYATRGKGLMIGHDRIYGDLAVGGAVSYLAAQFQDDSALSSNSNIDTFAADLYAVLSHPSGWFGSGVLGYGLSNNRIYDRRVLKGLPGWNHADYSSHTLAASLSIGRDFWLGDSWTLSPSIGVDYVGNRSGEHTQSFGADNGSGGDTILAGKIYSHSTTIPLNLAASLDIATENGGVMTFTGSAGYAYELNDDIPSGTIDYAGLAGIVGSVNIAGRAPGRHLFTLGLRAKYYYRQYEFGFGYDYTGKRKYNSHTFTLNAGVNF